MRAPRAPRRSIAWHPAFALLLVGLSSCSRCNKSGSAAVDAAPSPSVSTTVAVSGSAGPQAAAARCTAIGTVVRLGGSAESDDAQGAPVPFATEIGGAAGDAAGFVIGARAAGLFGEALVLRIDRDGNKLDTLAKFLPTAGVTRAPMVASDGKRVLAAALVVGPGGDTPSSDVGGSRALHVAEALDAKLQTIADLPQTIDESEAASMLTIDGGAAIAWDDADPTGAIGRVHLSLVTSTNANAPRDAGSADDVVSPPTSDAAWPLLVRAPEGARALLVWLAERPERDDSDGGAGEPTQLEAYRWVEAVVVDLATGKAIGAPRALTKQDGHAQTVAAVWTKSGVVVVVRDDPRPTDGDGGELIATRAPIDASFRLGDPTSAAIAPRDVAPGVPFVLMNGEAIFTSYLTTAGEARLVPTWSPATGSVGGGAFSIEPSLAGRHVVAASGDRLLASKLSGAGLELSVVKCTP